jgi:hypothetical protein
MAEAAASGWAVRAKALAKLSARPSPSPLGWRSTWPVQCGEAKETRAEGNQDGRRGQQQGQYATARATFRHGPGGAP